MRFLLCFGLLLVAGQVNSGTSPYFSSESEEMESSEFGGPPGTKGTTCQCGWTNKPGNRVVGGVDSGMHEYPYIVALIDRMRNQFCGGTVITPYHVITAAHCTVKYITGRWLSVAVGDHDVTRRDETRYTQEIMVKKIIQHENYDDELVKHDISLLVLSKAIKFNKFVGPACLPSGPQNIEKKYVKLVGWGMTDQYGLSSDILQKVTLRIVPLHQCEKVYSDSVVAKDRTQICTHGNAKGSCMGDSGGPLLWLDPETNRYTLSGIVSFGAICASLDPSVYTDVSAYLDWIRDNIAASTEDPSVVTCTKK